MGIVVATITRSITLGTISPGTPTMGNTVMWFKEIGFWTLSIVWIFNRLNTRHFGDWICLRPQVKEGKKRIKKPLFWMMDKVQKPISLIQQPSSEPFRINYVVGQ
jgi:hypothetical protein